jgi:hypothetical protein
LSILSIDNLVGDSKVIGLFVEESLIIIIIINAIYGVTCFEIQAELIAINIVHVTNYLESGTVFEFKDRLTGIP